MRLKNKVEKLCSIPLWDRCMLLIMVVLLIECAYLTIFGKTRGARDNTIDVVIRAGVSSLFGYFLSANFLNTERYKKNIAYNVSGLSNQLESRENEDENTKEIQIKVPEECKTNYSWDEDWDDSSNRDDSSNGDEIKDCHWRMRVKIISAFALFSILILIIMRNFSYGDQEHLPFIAMFANITSGSLGYLIGYLPYRKLNLGNID